MIHTPEVLDRDDSLPADLLALRRFSKVLDRAVSIPGTKHHVGLDAILGLVPGAGDLLGAGISLWIVFGGLRHRVPAVTVLKMLGHIAIDALVGAVPVLGDIFDAFWEGNVRNAELVIKHRDRTRPPRAPKEIAGIMAGVTALVLLIVFAAVALVLTGVVAVLQRLF